MINVNVRDTAVHLIHIISGCDYEAAMEACRHCSVYSLELWAAACKWAEATEVENKCPINAWANAVRAATQLLIEAGKGAPDNINALNLRHVLVALIIWNALEELDNTNEESEGEQD